MRAADELRRNECGDPVPAISERRHSEWPLLAHCVTPVDWQAHLVWVDG